MASATAMADSYVTLRGSDFKMIEVQPDASSGLNNILVVYNTKGCSLSFRTLSGDMTTVSRFSSMGAAYAEEMKSGVTVTSNAVNVELSPEDMGYMFEIGNMTVIYWVVNYANHPVTISGLYPADNQECDYTALKVEGTAEPIYYYTINGQRKEINREIYLDYTTQSYDSEVGEYVNSDQHKVLSSVGPSLAVTPPAYCSSYFVLSADRFLREWNMPLMEESNVVAPYAVDCVTNAEQEDIWGDEPSNVAKVETSGLGGSAPATVSFTAACTEGVMHYEWQLARDIDFTYPEYRFYQKDIDYTFNEEGTFYMRFIGSNSDGNCETFGDVYTISIGASYLECPNAFSPNGDGVNDIWKVSYRSLIDFNCEIFSRNGQKIYSFTNPADGWDGTWHGKKVKSGVYYYVIVATGADGRKYKKSGDINIIYSRSFGTSTSPGEGDGVIPE